jgi:hypothetical protein
MEKKRLKTWRPIQFMKMRQRKNRSILNPMLIFCSLMKETNTTKKIQDFQGKNEAELLKKL